MVLADAEDVEPDLVGQLDLLDQVAQAHLGRQRHPALRIARHIGKGVQTEFNHGSDSPQPTSLRPYSPTPTTRRPAPDDGWPGSPRRR